MFCLSIINKLHFIYIYVICCLLIYVASLRTTHCCDSITWTTCVGRKEGKCGGDQKHAGGRRNCRGGGGVCVWGPTLLTSAGSASINVDDGGAQLVLRQQCGHTPPLVPTPHGPTFGKYCSLFTPFCLLLYHSSFGVPLYYPSIIPRIFFPLFLLVFLLLYYIYLDILSQQEIN